MHENTMKKEKVADLYPGMSIYKTSLTALREQDKNARVMDDDKFRTLAANIKKDSRLETLPLCTIKTNPSGNEELSIISGHHRVRAARVAEMEEIFVLVMDEALSADQIKSKQLAHNSINGRDDAQKLAEIYDEIQDIEQKIRSGINKEDLQYKINSITVEDIKVNFDFEILNILFMPHQKEEFENAMCLITADLGDNILVTEMKSFEKFKKAMVKTSKAENIRNASAILYKMVEIVRDHYVAKEQENVES